MYFKDHKLCFNCGINGHQARQCIKQSCTVCKKKHHTSLHDDSYGVTVKYSPQEEAALALVPFKVNHKIYCGILDMGSSRNYISLTLSKALKVEPVEWTTKSLITIHGEASPKRLPRFEFEIQNLEGESFKTDAIALNCDNLGSFTQNSLEQTQRKILTPSR